MVLPASNRFGTVSVTKTSPCWNGFMVPRSTLSTGRAFCIVTCNPRAVLVLGCWRSGPAEQGKQRRHDEVAARVAGTLSANLREDGRAVLDAAKISLAPLGLPTETTLTSAPHRGEHALTRTTGNRD